MANPWPTELVCDDDASDNMKVTVQAEGGSPTFQWFGPGGILPTQTTAELRPDSAGYYYVVATDATGCSAYAGVNIKEYDSLNQQANIWHFGVHAGIDFNGLPDDPAVAIVGPLDAPEGTSVISDRNGQVIISTDGQHLFIPDGAGGFTEITPDPNPPGLGGDPESTQSALIVPVPDDETLFYIFTTQAVDVIGGGNFELRYSLYDIKQVNNGQNGLVQFNQQLFSRSTERITSNGNWLIAHEFGNNSFRAYRVSSQGIGNPVISSIGSDHKLEVTEHGQGYMEIGARSILAVALATPGVSNVVELFDFIDSTGVVTNFRTADLGTTAGEVYGLEISPAGNKLFATLKGPPSQIVEFSIDSVGNPHFKQRANFTENLGAMQIGPDGQIYVAREGNTALGTFSANEDTTAVSNLALQDFGLVAGTNSELGLPNFTQIISNPLQTPGVTAMSFCLGDSTLFSATGKDSAIDKFDWRLGDGVTKIDSGAQIGHVYSAVGTYNASVRIYNKCEEVGVFPITIVITAPPPDPSTAVNICTTDVEIDANPQDLPGFTYSWSTGETTETITVNQQAIYNVTITDAKQCTTDGSILVADNRPQVNFGPDLTLCQNAPLAPLNAQNPGATYAWQVDRTPSGATTQIFSVDTSLPATTEYIVAVTDPVTMCVGRDTINFTINESPVWIATPTDPTTCNASDGQIDLEITAPVGTLFTYFISGTSGSFSNTDQPTGVIPGAATGLDAGTYGVTVSDQVSGCATINTVNINDPGFEVSGTPSATCDPIMIDVIVDDTPGPFGPNFTYRVIQNGTATEVQPPTNGASPPLTFTTTTPLASNNQQYTVEITSGGCTVSSPPITIDESPSVTATLSADPCANPITVTATGGTGWAWTGPNITGAANIQTIEATPPQGNQTYNVTITQAGLCALDTAITVNVNNDVTADFTQTDACADQVTLSASPTGPYTYRWYRNGALIAGGGGQNLVVGIGENGVQYQVEVVNTVSGCVFDSETKPVNVAGEVDVILQSTLPCEGSPFTLTATPTPVTITTFQWTLDGSALSETSSMVTETRGGEYVVSVTQSGCTVSADINIVLAPVTPGSLFDSYIICPDPEGDPFTTDPDHIVVLDAGAFASYEWFMEGVLQVDSTDRTFTATQPGVYSVNLINTYGCASSDETLLIEECDPIITGPNAFRPEGLNKEFFLFTFYIAETDFNIFIFNRWGEMVFHSDAREFRWNGGYNNNLSQILPAGTYTYVVKYKSVYNEEKGVQEKRGGVVLLR